MSSTDPGKAEIAVKRFFEERLMPLASRRAADRKAFFPMHPDPQLPTYYKDREPKVMSKEDFEVAACDGFEEFEREMARLWSSQGHDDLAALAPELADLARQLYSVDDQTDEVSPFLYVMF